MSLYLQQTGPKTPSSFLATTLSSPKLMCRLRPLQSQVHSPCSGTHCPSSAKSSDPQPPPSLTLTEPDSSLRILFHSPLRPCAFPFLCPGCLSRPPYPSFISLHWLSRINLFSIFPLPPPPSSLEVHAHRFCCLLLFPVVDSELQTSRPLSLSPEYFGALLMPAL